MNRLRNGWRRDPAALLLKGAVRGYQLTLRGVIGSHCRFYPHCSAYAIEALDTHGAARGAWLAARRILRCHPWHPGGYDPVPPAETPATRFPEDPEPASSPSRPPRAVAQNKA
ncbi:membrane protein insertion efficiency factor YidD [Pseudoroseomonas cervicalis]|uniref:Putative membrane protein insertion efficiency factor n=1 Tax=Pseudoroseomonas cervicalis ATCC 49957 TaxID=525371 RepID=D5RNP7_9PROT|nr:membrane protein insertion efficiency factor YidD [Pseudoroseomonas cervicalis]EFH11071.1 conserved hypothetical protein YidD [Pseudoroseomonas cervicalis ATCC 49957]WBV41650.1 membrane protein insertion efficiency factor YidD [Pseudoroseomonas cervicalis]